ncbi:MAG: hypothetical protein L0338_28145 [Acidobacteria bacterium]|nr:hypothetical protein [Acidobacteriota bacterium]
MQLIREEFGGSRRSELDTAYRTFKEVISRLERIYNVRPFAQQTAQSLAELYALTKAIRPSTIFELGAGSRSSTIALAMAATHVQPIPRILSLDIAPVDFPSLVRTHFADFKFAPVQDIKMEATQFHIPPDWGKRVFMLYDAHDDDLPGLAIFPHARDSWFPAMPGAFIAVHDCSTYPRPQTGLAEHYHQAVYSPEITIVGYGEVPGLVAYLLEKDLGLGLPGKEMDALGIGGEGTSLIYFQLPAPNG